MAERPARPRRAAPDPNGGPDSNGGPASADLIYVAAPFFILAAPFAGYLSAADYGWGRAESLASLAVFLLLGLLAGALLANVSNRLCAAAATALIAVSVDFMVPFAASGERFGEWTAAVLCGAALAVFALLALLRRAALAACALAFAVLAVWLAVTGGAERDRWLVERGGAASGDETLPPVVHIVLDGHNALAGLRGEGAGALRAEIGETWTGRGFHVHARAYSQYYDAWNGIAALANFDLPDRDSVWLDSAVRAGDRRRPALAAAAYIEHLAGRGYAVSVHQTDRLDLCAGAAVASCVTWHGASPGSAAALDLPFAVKFALLQGLYLERSGLYRALRRAWAGAATPLAARLGIAAPAPFRTAARIDSLAAPAMGARLAADLRAGGPGRAWIVHFPAAAPPWAWNGACVLDPERARWLGPYDDALPAPRRNDAGGRERRREREAAQLACAHRRLAEIIDAVDETPALAGATIIVHGSHGGHVVAHEPSLWHEGLARPDDFVDGFSTFLAVRAPGVAAGVDDRPVPLQAAFPTFFGLPPAGGGADTLFLRGRPGGPLSARAPDILTDALEQP